LDGYTIDTVPVNGNGSEADWDLQPAENNLVTLKPYPFQKDPLDISILARRIPKRHYSDDFDVQKTLAMAPFYAMHFTLSAGSADAFARAARA